MNSQHTFYHIRYNQYHLIMKTPLHLSRVFEVLSTLYTIVIAHPFEIRSINIKINDTPKRSLQDHLEATLYFSRSEFT